jgi:MscS family membrane protein
VQRAPHPRKGGAKDLSQFISALEGEFGWIAEGLTLLVLIVFVNVFLKMLLLRLHSRFISKQRSKNDIWKDTLVMGIIKPLTTFVWYVAIVQGLSFIWSNIVQKRFIFDPHNLLVLGGIIAFGWFLLRWKKIIVERLIEANTDSPAFDKGKVDAVNKVATLLIYVFLGMILLEQTGSSINTLLAFGGVSGLAIAFASQQIIANFFGGILIYFTHPFAVGDWITLPEKNVEGNVEEIGWYTTRVRTFDKRPIYIPNALLTNILVTNPSRMSHRQFKETVILRYADLPKLPDILADLEKYFHAMPAIDQHLIPQIHFMKFGSLGIEIQINAYTQIIDKSAYHNIVQELLFGISKIVFKRGADFAIPTTAIEFPKGLFS